MALSLALCFSGYSKAEDITTGNLVGNTGNAWTGCYTNQSGVFWGGVSGGPCPGYDSSTGQIIFSYGQYTLSQSIAINQALANAGSNLQVTGYNYSWWIKNSNINGQQPGNYDPIAYIDVNLYNANGSLLINDRYNYGYHIPSWQIFSGTRTYSNPYDVSLLGNIQLAVTSKDSGFWAGYYGPELMNFNLSLNYSLKPTQQLPKISAPPSANIASIDPTKIDATSTDIGGVEMSTSGGLQTPDNIPQIVKDSKKSTGIGLSIVSRNRERERVIITQQQNTINESNESLALSFTRAGNILGADLNNLTSPTNPVNSVLQGGIRPMESNQQEKTTVSVKKDTPNNNIAGDVDISSLAQTPQGFEIYMNGMKDGQFYPPKEIYKGQRTVDNARAERFLNSKSDVLHQMMIEQQYNIGK